MKIRQKTSLFVIFMFFSLPVLACNLFQPASSDGSGAVVITGTLFHQPPKRMPKLPPNYRQSRLRQELEAESVAYVVCKHFGMDGLASPNYIALHGATAEMIMAHLERIRNTATEIIKAIETEDDS